MKEGALLPGFFKLPFFYTAQAHLPKDGTAAGGRQEAEPTDVPTGQSDRGNPFTEIPSSQVRLGCVKWTQVERTALADFSSTDSKRQRRTSKC